MTFGMFPIHSIFFPLDFELSVFDKLVDINDMFLQHSIKELARICVFVVQSTLSTMSVLICRVEPKIEKSNAVRYI